MNQLSSAPASPWDALLRGVPVRLSAEPAASPDAKPGTKLAGLLAELESRTDATTLTLSVCCDLTSRQVWGLLKAPRECGQVRFERGRWSLVRGFAGRDVERAVQLLRERGWRVEPPNASMSGPQRPAQEVEDGTE